MGSPLGPTGDYFESVEKAEDFYREYAERGGFDVRVSTKKTNRIGLLTSRYWFCSREGLPLEKSFDSLSIQPGTRRHRNVNLKRTGCKACFKIHLVKELNRYAVYSFVEWHNHTLFLKMKCGRQLNYSEQKNVFHSSTHKVGVTKAHRLRAAIDGGVQRSGPTKRDYHNYKRDMNTFVGNNDARMLLNTMNSRWKICPEYFFEYKCCFWADEKAKLNYKEFGDAISFDATYRTNKHAMVFVPFVAIDNHKNTVVIGAALMSGKTEANYLGIEGFLESPW
ncbi:hypothetical protein OSB04_031377 [Centaurea solstitialis]|uniref:Protein FAR1-RELATED SEQUENCE n=1 Tax=Centaurea solstitialis TaxID=347529 RepID=A0AA38SAM0_9ASTR|nr:hypothetical protein OSB04_031377 [Centaurea solstitialis]